MTSIESIFIKQGSPIKAEDIKLKDIVAIQWAHTDGLTVEEWSTRSEVSLTAKYRLVYRPTPKLPTTPGSILVDPNEVLYLVLTPHERWYGTEIDDYYKTDAVQEWLADGTYTILLDTGATK